MPREYGQGLTQVGGGAGAGWESAVREARRWADAGETPVVLGGAALGRAREEKATAQAGPRTQMGYGIEVMAGCVTGRANAAR